VPRPTSKPPPKVETVPAAHALNAGGKGVWLGWHEHRGWVILDRTIPFNSGSGGQFCFVQTSDWSLYHDEKDAWKNNVGYAYYAQHLAAAGPESKDALRSAVETLCKDYPERGPGIHAQIELSLAKKEEGARLDDMRRRAEKDVEQAEAARRLEEERTLWRIARIAALKNAMLERQKEDSERIRQFVQERNITSLHHFTRIENLPGILTSGIIPRAAHPDGIQYNDDQRLDDFLDASSFSVSFPNYKMFYRYRCLNPNLNWAILAISPETLIDHPCLFFPTNAASYRFRQENDGERNARMGLAGLTSMFFDEPAGLREDRGLPLAWTTDPQAEVLVFGTINPQRFNTVVFFRPDAGAAELIRERQPNIRLIVGGPLFNARADYQYWQTAGA
jgi:hypothetical protein